MIDRCKNLSTCVRELQIIQVNRREALRIFVGSGEFRQAGNRVFQLYRAFVNRFNFKIDLCAGRVKFITFLKQVPVFVAGGFKGFVPIHSEVL